MPTGGLSLPVSADKHLEQVALAGRVACFAGCLAGCLGSTACVRPPLTGFCTEMAPGDLVVTELRGYQGGSYRQWLELYNASDATLALYGVRLVFTKVDGKSPVGFVIRDEDLEVEPGGYVVIGGGDPASEDYIDYDYTPDYHVEPDKDDPPGTPLDPRDLYGAAVLEVFACDVLVDVVLYKSLPTEGTLALDGASAPDAAANDDSDEGWCVDVSVGEGPQTEIGLRGSPGEANPPCP
jgi:hypothetical protein